MNSKKKIFIDAHIFDNEFQGSRTFVKEIYNRLTIHDDFEFYFAAHKLENLQKSIVKRENVIL